MTLLLAGLAKADDPFGDYLTEISCQGSSQVEINACVSRVLQESDAKLNELYTAMRRQATPKEREYLRRMQRGWLEMRDATCALYESDHAGAANPSAWGTFCRASMVTTRVKELKQIGTRFFTGQN